MGGVEGVLVSLLLTTMGAFSYLKFSIEDFLWQTFMVPSQFVLKSTRTQVNSFSFWSIRTHLVNSYSLFGQFVLILVNSSSFWSTRTHAFWSVRTHFGTSI